MGIATRWLCCLTCLFTVAVAIAAEDYSGQELDKRDFSNRNMEGANFEDASLVFAKFIDSTLTGGNFKDADLTNADFRGAELTGADFRGAVIALTGFQTARLENANFSGVNLNKVSFQGCRMKGANFRGCKGMGDVQNADLRNADLRGVVWMVDVYYLGGCRFQGAKYDKDTRWPKGFDIEASGAVLVTADDVEPPPAAQSALPRAKGTAEERKAPKLDGETLTEEVVKYLLETQMWGSKIVGEFTYDYKQFKMAPPRKADFATDGSLGANAELIVVPVRVQCTITKHYDNNETASRDVYQDYKFYRDDFGEWTYQFSANL